MLAISARYGILHLNSNHTETQAMRHPRLDELESQWITRNGSTGNGICALVAWSVITDDSIFNAYRILNQAAGKTLNAWDSRHPDCGWPGMLKAIKDRGYDYVCVPKQFWAGKTIKTFTRNCDKNSLYWIAIQGGRHIVAIRDGQAIDWTSDRCHRITTVYELTKRG